MSSDPLPLDRDRAEAALEDDPVVAEVAYQDDASVPGLTPPGAAGPQADGLTPSFVAPDEDAS